MGELLKTLHDTVHGMLLEMNSNAVLLQTIAPILSNQHLDTIIAKIEECIDMTVLNGTSKSNFASKNARLFSVKVSVLLTICDLRMLTARHMLSLICRQGTIQSLMLLVVLTRKIQPMRSIFVMSLKKNTSFL